MDPKGFLSFNCNGVFPLISAGAKRWKTDQTEPQDCQRAAWDRS